jgi:hypothetical protein
MGNVASFNYPGTTFEHPWGILIVSIYVIFFNEYKNHLWPYDVVELLF